MIQEKGNLSVHTENIFPIIKKFLYSDHDIFLRELVSNAVDASQKLKRLSSLAEFSGELGTLKVKVSVDEQAGTITISDNGIGMTADEIKKYINQIAFSGATDFIEKYKDKGEDKQIIGHFGLGFYSAFMVASKVELITKSFRDGSEAIRWECDGSTEFQIDPIDKAERGTDVILHVAEDSKEFLDKYKVKTILDKYCKFLPVEIEYDGETINNPTPLWTKSPSDLKDEDYLKFYKELYPFSEDPLFWIHLNVDYPFNLTGILYFPKLKGDFELHKNKIQLYSRQVFITDEVKDVVPEFLMLLHGVIDSPDIPLNVSRSYLQADSNVKKINAHITKKVADKLSELFNNNRKSFEEKWDDIGVFVKYGMLAEDKFYEKAKDFCLLKNTDNNYSTIQEYIDKVKPAQTDKNEHTVLLYTFDPNKQDSFIRSAKRKNYDVLILNGVLDSHFINLLERKFEKVNLKRVDADSPEKLIEKDEKLESVLTEEQQNKVKDIFEKAINKPSVKIGVESHAPDEIPATIVLPEFMRRMKEMAATNGLGMMGKLPDDYSLVINGNHQLVSKLINLPEENATKIARQVYDLALLSQNMLTGAELTTFIERSVEMASL